MRTPPPELRVDTSEQRPVYLRIGPSGAYMRLSPSAHLLLNQVHRGASFADIAAAMSRQGQRQVSAAQVEAAHAALQLRIADIDKKAAAATLGGFWFRWRLLPAPLVARVAARLAWAFQPLVVALVLIITAAAATLVLGRCEPVDPRHFWPAYGLFLLSLLCHELGHASACARYGAAPSEIGFTAYLLYPAFYSNVSSAWTLRRWQRMVVDVGGVYFQLVFGAFCALASALFQAESLRLCLVFIAGSCLLSLNPILKFDGYWLVADALGVTNLGQQPGRIYRHWLHRCRGQATEPLPWPPAIAALLGLYTLAATGFWVLFIIRLLPTLWTCARAYPSTVAALVRPLLLSAAWPERGLVWSFATSTYLLLFLVVISSRLTRSLLRWVRRGLAARKK